MLWVEIFCVPTCFHVRIPKPCLSVCLYPEWRSHHSFVNISPTLVGNWYINGKVFTRTATWKPKNLNKKVQIRILTCDEDMQLYDDIGNASSSLWGSTSSFKYYLPLNISLWKTFYKITIYSYIYFTWHFI